MQKIQNYCISGRLGSMEQSDLDTAVIQKRLTPQRDTQTSCYNQDSITSRSTTFPTGLLQSCTLADDDVRLLGSSGLLQASLGCTHSACWLTWVCSNGLPFWPDLVIWGLCKIQHDLWNKDSRDSRKWWQRICSHLWRTVFKNPTLVARAVES